MAIRLIRKGNVNVSNDHNLQFNRGLADQHPISSITGLQTELDGKYIKPIGGIPKEDLSFSASSQDDIDKLLTRIAKLETLTECIDDNYVIEYQYDVNQVLIGQTIKCSDDKVTTFNYTDGNITKEVTVTKEKTMTRVYTYDSNKNMTSVTVTVT